MSQVTSSNFTSFVASAAVTLVLFAQPDCPHEPADLRSTLAAAATVLRENPSEPATSIALTEDLALAEEAGVRIFPALRLYRGGTASGFTTYRGPVTPAAAVASRLRREPAAAVPLFVNSVKAVRDEVDAVEQTAVLFAPRASTEVAHFVTLFRADPLLRRHISFVVAEPALSQHFEVDDLAPDDGSAGTGKGGSLLMLFRKFDEEVLVFPGGSAVLRGRATAHAQAVGTWLRVHSLPLLAEIGSHNYEHYEAVLQASRAGEALGADAAAADAADDDSMVTAVAGTTPSMPLVWLFLNSSCAADRGACAEHNAATLRVVTAEAARHRGSAVFAWLDGDRYSHHARSLAVSPGVLPVAAAEADGAHYVYGGSLTNADNVAKWVELVVRRQLRPTLRSVPPTLHDLGSLHEIVAATFDEHVLRTTDRATLLLVHAPWCGDACTELLRAFEHLADAWREEAGLRIATFDAGSNNLPRTLPVVKLPTILLFPASSVASAATAGDAASQEAGGGTPPTSAEAAGAGPGRTRLPYDLSELRTVSDLREAVLKFAGVPLRRPADTGMLAAALDTILRFQREALPQI